MFTQNYDSCLLCASPSELDVAPLPKANQKKHLEENLSVVNFEISEEHMTALGAFNKRRSALGSFRTSTGCCWLCPGERLDIVATYC